MDDTGSIVLGAAIATCLLNSSEFVRGQSVLAITLPLTANTIYSHLSQGLQQSGWFHSLVASTSTGMPILFACGLSLFGPIKAEMSLAIIIGAIVLREVYWGRRASS